MLQFNLEYDGQKFESLKSEHHNFNPWTRVHFFTDGNGHTISFNVDVRYLYEHE